MTLAGPSAVYVDLEVEKWLKPRMAATEVTHVVHAPSNPPGWTAGKWGEWYPDVLGAGPQADDGNNQTLLAAGLAQAARPPDGGDVGDARARSACHQRRHACDRARNDAAQRRARSQGKSVNVALPGTIGTRPGGWPSVGIRGTPALPSAVLDLEEQVKPIEQHGFILADFTADKIVLRFFKWDVKTQPVEAIDTLQPFHTAELGRPL